MKKFFRKPSGRRAKPGVAPKSVKQAARIMALAKSEALTKNLELNPRQHYVKNAVGIFGALMVAFLVYVIGLSQLFFVINQNQLRADFKTQLEQGIAPTGEVDFNSVILQQGVPVAIIRIPDLGIDQVVVKGTDSGTLTLGIGHRRDTVMPGQAGTAVLFGRAAAYGGPFGQIQTLKKGSEISFITGQGESKYEVLGVRYEGDYSLPAIAAGEGRLMLITARGAPFVPDGIVRLDAQLVGQPKPNGVVISNIFNLPKQERELGFDLRFAWALVFALQLLLVSIIAAVWASSRLSAAQVYLVFTPLILLSTVLVLDQVVKVLPNLL